MVIIFRRDFHFPELPAVDQLEPAQADALSRAVDCLTDKTVASPEALLSYNPSILKLLLHLQNSILSGGGSSSDPPLISGAGDASSSSLLSDRTHQLALLSRADAALTQLRTHFPLTQVIASKKRKNYWSEIDMPVAAAAGASSSSGAGGTTGATGATATGAVEIKEEPQKVSSYCYCYRHYCY